MQLPIILIGPIRAGKSALAEALSKKLSIPETPIDYVAGYYYVKQGVDLVALAEIMHTKTVIEYVDFMREYELNAALAACHEFGDTIISFGAGHAYFTDPDHIEKIMTLRNLTPNIFLILPTEDLATSSDILTARIDESNKNAPEEKRLARIEMNRRFIESASMHQLAHHVVYNDQKTVDETCDEIIGLLK